MLSSSPLPDPHSPFYINTNPIVTPYQHLPDTAHPLPYHSPAIYPGPSMDPATADFRAFYPYTPNEVKHRKRTTSTQLKTLESVFRRDTKPNGPLRVELATKLGMTPRGVQVWFQNRRAKEKNKACKATKATTDVSESDASNQDIPASPDDAEYPDDSPEHQSPPDVDDSSPSSASASPPALHVNTEAVPPAWQGPRSDNLPLDQSIRLDSDLHAARRGSLPVNAFIHTEHRTNSPQVDAYDPFARRLSVDASLQRLANNPYAHLARAKNGALFGTRGMVQARHRPLGRMPFPHYLQRAVSHNAPTNYRLDIRRASADPRSFHLQPQGPSPSSFSHYHGRTSLPEHNLYAVTSRPLPSPIPGPLPSPNFSFGAASTPSMASTSSGSSDRNSPDSLQSFTFRGEEFDEEDLTSACVSRFGSIASVATSDSSINSAYYPDVNGCAARDPGAHFDVTGRRDSCASGHFLTLMSDLAVNGMPEEHNSYVPHDDSNVQGIVKANQNEPSMEFLAYSSHPSPTSTISPEHGGSPHVQNNSSSSLPISRSSELAFALQSPDEQVQHMDEPLKQATYTGHPVTPPSVQHQYYGVQDAASQQSTAPASLEYVDNRHYNQGAIASHEQLYDTSASQLHDGYSVETHNINNHFEYHAPISSVYGAYGGAVDPTMVSPLENCVQHAEPFITYA